MATSEYVAEILRNLDMVIKNPTLRFMHSDMHVGKLRAGPAAPIVVAVAPSDEATALFAQVAAVAAAANYDTQAVYVAPPNAEGQWPLDVSLCYDRNVFLGMALYARARPTEPTAPTEPAEEDPAAMTYVSPFTQAAVRAAKAELVETARELAQAVLRRLTDTHENKAWNGRPGLRVTGVTNDDGGNMYFKPSYVLLHKYGRFSAALAAATSEWIRTFPGLVATRALDGYAIGPRAGKVDETAFPPGKNNCNWMNVVIAAQEFPTRREGCDGKPYLFEDLAAVELDFAKLAFATMRAVSNE